MAYPQASQDPLFTAPVYREFENFVCERQKRFEFRRHAGKNGLLLSSDPILDTRKFTNAYRILDRVTQYEIANVIDGKFITPLAHAVAIFIFRTLNSIHTYASIHKQLLYNAHASRRKIFERLRTLQASGVPIFGNAYLMPSGHTEGYTKRLDFFEAMLEGLLMSGQLQRMYVENDIRRLYGMFREVKGMGDFLAYQYALDFSYRHSGVDYDSFVVPGVGCVRGMKKTFPGLSVKQFGLVLSEITYRGITGFEPLEVGGKVFPLRGNDIQNCFCEWDKYTRVRDGEGRMKARFDHPARPLDFEVVVPKAWRV